MTPIKCKACGWTGNNPGFKDKPVKDDIIEIGLQCPRCGKWYHSHYVNDELLQMQATFKGKAVVSRRAQRAYKKKFDALQKQMREDVAK